MQAQDVAQLIADDTRMMHILRAAESLHLPDWCVCAGFVRAKVWDVLHGFEGTVWPDVDVVYFAPDQTDESTEKEYEALLKRVDASVPWSVKNQARMHSKNGHEPYTSTYNALANFPEVCTAIGVRLNANGGVELLAPYGVDDLVNMVVRPTPFFTSPEKRHIYERRMVQKKWAQRWPRVRVLHP